MRGQLVLDAAGDRANVVTTRPCGTHCPRRTAEHGTIAAVAGGSLKINRGLTTVTDGMHVVVAGGELAFRGEAGRVAADGGTRLALRPHSPDAEQPALRFLNNGGWYAGADVPGRRPTRVRIHGAVLTKERGSNTSSIQGDVVATAPVQARIDTGTLAIEGIDTDQVTSDLVAGSSLSTGSCAAGDEGNGCTPTATPVRQAATVSLPDGRDRDRRLDHQGAWDRGIGGSGGGDQGRGGGDAGRTRRHWDCGTPRRSRAGSTADTTAVAMTRRRTGYRNLGPCTGGGRGPALDRGVRRPASGPEPDRAEHRRAGHGRAHAALQPLHLPLTPGGARAGARARAARTGCRTCARRTR